MRPRSNSLASASSAQLVSNLSGNWCYAAVRRAKFFAARAETSSPIDATSKEGAPP